MGIKGLYGYCLRNIKDCYKKVYIKQEIINAYDETPKILIDLHTLSYHFKINKEALLCGYQLNKIKYRAEMFFKNLKEFGAELIFAYQKPNGKDQEFLTRRSNDYMAAIDLLDKIKKIQDFDKLLDDLTLPDYPFNVIVTLCLIQSAEKYGKVYGFDSTEYLPAFLMAQFATKEKCSWILGLSTFRFLLPGDWKIWSDEKLDMEDMTVLEFDKEAILKHFQIEYRNAPLFFTLSGMLECEKNLKTKVFNNFGTVSKFKTVASFVRVLHYPLSEKSYEYMAKRILGANYPISFIADLKKSIEKLTINPEVSIKPTIAGIDDARLKKMGNEFLSFAEEILFNHKPIFFSPVFMDLDSSDMKNFNDLVLPLIQKTAGILLKNSSDRATREVVMFDSQKMKFQKHPLDIIYPDFDIPPLKDIISGDISTIIKMKILFWIMNLKLSDIEMPCLTEEYTVDCMILSYLVKKNSLTIMESRCILKTIFDTRSNVPYEYSTDYPKKVNSRALRCTFLYYKMFMILNSCLSSIGMEHLCSELKFDGVYFQRMYSMNVLDEPEDDVDDGNEPHIIASANFPTETELIDLFTQIIQL